MMTRHVEGAGLAALTVLCWASYNVAAKHGIETGFSPEALTFLRFAVPGAIALPLLTLFHLQGRRVDIPKARLVVLVLLGGPLFGLAAVSGYGHAPLSHGLLFAPVAVFVMGSFLGWLLLKERISSSRLAGAIVMFIGLAILVGFEVRGLGETWGQGVALFILAGVMWGSYTVLLRLWSIPMIEGTMAVAAGSAFIAVPIAGVTASETLLSASASSLALQIVMQGIVGGVVSIVALIGVVRTLSAQFAALLPVFTPVVALAIAGILLGEAPSGAELVGVTIIGSGFLLSFGNQLPQITGLARLTRSKRARYGQQSVWQFFLKPPSKSPGRSRLSCKPLSALPFSPASSSRRCGKSMTRALGKSAGSCMTIRN